jgi:SAM-dependent methyltransferase
MKLKYGRMVTSNLSLLNDRRKRNSIFLDYIEQQAKAKGHLDILEAGCGRSWPFDLHGIDYTLTGVDTSKEALEIREKQQKDLHKAILTDLRYAKFEHCSFDIIYSSFVLEHIQGVEVVLNNFIKWLKPDGLMLLRFPDRDSVFGFITRFAPYWFQVFYKKHFQFYFKRYILGKRNIGKPNPFPAVYDETISRSRFREFNEKHNLLIREEYGFDTLSPLERSITKVIGAMVFGKLTSDHSGLMYVIQKK